MKDNDFKFAVRHLLNKWKLHITSKKGYSFAKMVHLLRKLTAEDYKEL